MEEVLGAHCVAPAAPGSELTSSPVDVPTAMPTYMPVAMPADLTFSASKGFGNVALTMVSLVLGNAR
jgi:hypothetical protein